MRTAFYTLGCKLNQLETEALASAFRSRGFFIASWEEEADIYIINTCTVTTKSEQKARRIIRKLGREFPDSLVVVTGCYVELEEANLREEFDRVLLVPQHKKSGLLAAAERFEPHFSVEELKRFVDAPPETAGPFDYKPGDFQFHSRPYVKIQDGCDNRCAYCRVPLARGKSVSIEPEKAVRTVTELDRRGFAEAVITGVNISSYRSGKTGFADILQRFLDNTTVIRFRLSSVEPDTVDDQLVSIFAHPRIRPHFHLPLQSGSDRVLHLMKRKYLSDTSRKVFERLRRTKGDPFIAADIIVGFPGEGEEEFEAGRTLISELRPAQLHVFQFSPRPGTAAYGMKPKVREGIVKERSKVLRELSETLHREYTKRWIGKTVEAVVVSKDAEKVSLVTENYLHLTARDTGDKPEAGRGCRIRIEERGSGITARLL